MPLESSGNFNSEIELDDIAHRCGYHSLERAEALGKRPMLEKMLSVRRCAVDGEYYDRTDQPKSGMEGYTEGRFSKKKYRLPVIDLEIVSHERLRAWGYSEADLRNVRRFFCLEKNRGRLPAIQTICRCQPDAICPPCELDRICQEYRKKIEAS